MKNKLLLVIFAVILIPVIEAKPIISNTVISPSTDLWLEDTAHFSFDCFEENYTIVKTEAKITSPIVMSITNISGAGNTYSFDLDLIYPYLGEYNVTIYCESDNQIENSSSENVFFNVYNLSASMYAPNSVYVGDDFEVNMKIKRNDVELDGNFSNDLTFSVYVDNNLIGTKNPYYEIRKGWVIGTNGFSVGEGLHSLKVTVSFRQKTIELSKNIEVKPVVDFGLINIDKTEVVFNDVITIKTFARDRGYKLDDNFNLSFYINSIFIVPNILTVTNSTDATYMEVKLPVPNLNVGEYDLLIKFAYKNYLINETRKIFYPLQISGRVIDSNDNSVNTQIKIVKNGSVYKSLSTNSSGHFYSLVSPGKYDVQIDFLGFSVFPGARLLLNETDIEGLNNPIRFDVLKDIVIDGIGYGGLYLFELNCEYTQATLEMFYDDRKIPDENEIVVYRCDDWSIEKRICNENWSEIEYKLDASQNKVKIITNHLSAFVIGYNKKLNLNLATDKSQYFLRDLIKVSGYVEDDEGRAVAGTKVDISILSTNIKQSVTTDSNGVFSLEFLGPETIGRFTIAASAEKYPYQKDDKKIEINVTKSKKAIIFMEDSIKLSQGENSTIFISIINNGQSDLYNLFLNLTGIPKEYYLPLVNSIPELKAGEEKKVAFELIIPSNASATNHLGTFSLNYDGEHAEKQFLLSISEKIFVKENSTQNNSSNPWFKMPTMKVVLPKFNKNLLVLFISVIIIFATFYIMKVKKNEKVGVRKEVNDMLKSIEVEVRGKNK